MSDLVLVDTDVFSLFFRRDPLAESYASLVAGHTLCLSFMTVAELDYGALKAGWGIRRRFELEGRIASFTVYYPDRELCERWGEVMAESRKLGRPMGFADAWIAATALELGCPLATHNASDFEALQALELLTVRQH